MSLKSKLLASLLLLLAVLGSGIAFIQQTVVIPKVESFEIDALREDLERIKDGLDRELTHMHRMATDWAQWDDTYDFVVSRTPEYVESALGGNAMEQLSMDILLITQDEKLVTYQSTQVLSSLREPLVSTLLRGPESRLLNEGGQGLVATPAGVMLVAANPILTTEGEGPSRGTLYFGQMIDADLTKQLRPPQIRSILLRLDPNPPRPDEIKLLPGSDSVSKTWVPLINDPGRSLQIELQQARPFLDSMRAYTYYIMGTIFVLGILGSVVTYILLKHYLLSPIERLQHNMQNFSVSHSLADIPTTKSSDEIGQLTRSFKEMATRISDNHTSMLHRQEKLKEQSLTDPLTRLGNRRYLESRLKQPEFAKKHAYIATFSTDLDHFKQVNDRYGHDNGDTVLREFAEVLQGCCRDDDCVARVGGEEFTAVCGISSIRDASEIAERIRARTEQKGFVEGKIDLTCSVGFIVIPGHELDTDMETWSRVMKVADLALYEAKESGRNRWVGWRNPLHAEKTIEALPASAEELRQAVRAEALVSIN